MRCDEFIALLPEFLDSELSRTLQAQAKSHAESCPQCRKELEIHQAIANKITLKGSVALPPGLHEKIVGMVSQIPELNGSIPQPSSTGFGQKVLTNVLWVSIVVVFAGLYILSKNLSPIPVIPESNQSLYEASAIESSFSSQAQEPAKPLASTAQTLPSAQRMDAISRISVAAADSGVKNKSQARFVCSGQNDENQIMAAFNKLGPYGGIIELEEGTYHCSGVLSLPSAITIQGKGSAKTFLKFDLKNQKFSIVISRPNIRLQDFTLIGPPFSINASNVQVIGVDRVPINWE